MTRPWLIVAIGTNEYLQIALVHRNFYSLDNKIMIRNVK